MMTKQETFNTVVRGLLKQGRQSVAWHGCCRYRHVTEDGMTLKCAAGMLIPDEKYDPMFEGLGIVCDLTVEESGFFDPEISRLRNIFIDAGHDLNLVRDLMHVHDGFGFHGKGWREYLLGRMQKVARRWGLSELVLREQG